MAEANQLIGRYRLLQRLGAGGMGEVWKALDTGVTQREVALKLVLSEENPQMIQVLAGEARAMAQLPVHPNLVALLDVVEEGNSLALVMEYIHGPTLRTLIRSYPTGLPWAMLLPLAEGLIYGLEHAHGHRIIHRDLKPENVKLLSFDGTKPLKFTQVKILDFGLARAAKDQSIQFTQGASGTFAYMAPEQLTGQAQSEATDIYALGILLFEMACGCVPFGGPGKESFGAVYQGHTTEPPPPPSTIRLDASEEFDQALLFALAKQQSARPKRAEDLEALLLPVLARLAQDRTLAVPVAVRGLPSLEAGSRPASSSPWTRPLPKVTGSDQGNATVLDVRSGGTPSSAGHGSLRPRPAVPAPSGIVPGIHAGYPCNKKWLWSSVIGLAVIGIAGFILLRGTHASPTPLPSQATTVLPVNAPNLASNNKSSGSAMSQMASPPIEEIERDFIKDLFTAWIADTQAEDADLSKYYADILDFYSIKQCTKMRAMSEKRKMYVKYSNLSLTIENLELIKIADGEYSCTYDKTFSCINRATNRPYTGKVKSIARFRKINNNWLLIDEEDERVYYHS